MHAQFQKGDAKRKDIFRAGRCLKKDSQESAEWRALAWECSTPTSVGTGATSQMCLNP